MLRSFCIIVILLKFSSAAFGQLRSTGDLKGIWNGNGLRVEFIDDSKISVMLPDGQKYNGSYYADFFHTPIVLEISCNDGLGKVEFKCLIELQPNNSLKWQLFDKAADQKKISGTVYTLVKQKR